MMFVRDMPLCTEAGITRVHPSVTMGIPVRDLHGAFEKHDNQPGSRGAGRWIASAVPEQKTVQRLHDFIVDRVLTRVSTGGNVSVDLGGGSGALVARVPCEGYRHWCVRVQD